MGAAWVLNLDAELELARPRGYAPTREVRAHVARWAAPARALFAPGDIELAPDAAPGAGRGRQGRAWCPTPSALARLRAAGAQAPAAPALDVLRRVVERSFAAHLRAGDEGGFERAAAGVRARLDAAQPGSAWLLKRGFSLAGRGRRRVSAGALSAADLAWIAAACALAGVQVEPWRAVAAEFALHGLLAVDGVVQSGRVCVQECDGFGAWRATRPARADELAQAERTALERAFERCAAALSKAGYHGPFGIDAYRHARGFQALGELNARYSMGWAVGFGRVQSSSAAECSA